MKAMTYLFLTLLSILACTPEYVPEPFDPSDWIGTEKCDTTLKLIWQKPISADTHLVTTGLFELNGRYLINNVPFEERQPDLGFFKLSGSDLVLQGKIVADPEKEIDVLTNKERDAMVYYKDIFCYSTSRNLYAINEHAQILWKIRSSGSIEEGYGSPRISSYKDLVLYPSHNGDIIEDKGMPTYLFGVNINTGSKKLLFTEPYSNFMISGIDPPVAYEVNGDLIATFQIRKYSYKDNHERSDLVAWNVTQNKVLWRLDSLDAVSSSNVPLYENGKIYCAISSAIVCLDAQTGRQLWKQEFKNFPYYFNFSSLLMTDLGLVAKSNMHEICLIDKETGQIVWENRDVGSTTVQLTYYKGDILFNNLGTGTLECVNARSGLIKWKAKAFNECKDSRATYATTRFVINPANNLLYICDNFFIQCFQLPGYD